MPPIAQDVFGVGVRYHKYHSTCIAIFFYYIAKPRNRFRDRHFYKPLPVCKFEFHFLIVKSEYSSEKRLKSGIATVIDKCFIIIVRRIRAELFHCVEKSGIVHLRGRQDRGIIVVEHKDGEFEFLYHTVTSLRKSDFVE